jgi:hypothetical protein
MSDEQDNLQQSVPPEPLPPSPDPVEPVEPDFPPNVHQLDAANEDSEQ